MLLQADLITAAFDYNDMSRKMAEPSAGKKLQALANRLARSCSLFVAPSVSSNVRVADRGAVATVALQESGKTTEEEFKEAKEEAKETRKAKESETESKEESKEVLEAFQTFDSDWDGFISVLELTKIMSSLGKSQVWALPVLSFLIEKKREGERDASEVSNLFQFGYYIAFSLDKGFQRSTLVPKRLSQCTRECLAPLDLANVAKSRRKWTR